MPEKKPDEAIDAIDLRIGIEKGKSTYERTLELYLINRAFYFHEIDIDEMKKRLDDWWKRGLDE